MQLGNGGRLMMGSNLCLDGSLNPVTFAACTGLQSQSWYFNGDTTISNQQSGQCLQANQGGGSSSLSLSQCTLTPAQNQMWMPLGFPITLGVPSVGAFEVAIDLERNYNSKNDDVALADQNSLGPVNTPSYWYYSVWQASDGSQKFALLNEADQMALDVYGGNVQNNVVDMATPNGTPSQNWFFAREPATSNGYVLIESALNGGGSCLDMQGNGHSAGTVIDLYACDSQYGNGSNPAQQWLISLYYFNGSIFPWKDI
jgi:hypothetical protein